MFHDIDADYTPQYVKLARILRDKIKSGEYKRGDTLPAADLAREHGVSVGQGCTKCTRNASREPYVTCPGTFSPYSVTWQPG